MVKALLVIGLAVIALVDYCCCVAAGAVDRQTEDLSFHTEEGSQGRE